MTSSDDLLRLLPSVYRRAGVARHALEPLLRAVAEQLGLLERDIQQLYENQFIETCEPWAIPYLGDLVSETAIAIGTPARNAIARREVANAIKLQDGKGTLATLEQLATEILELPVRAVELHNRLSYTQNVGHLRRQRGRTFQLQGTAAAEPFDGSSRTLGTGVGGRAALRCVALFVFPQAVHFVEKAAVRRVDEQQQRYRFACIDTQLFQRSSDPRRDVPSPLLRRDASRAPDGSLAVWFSDEVESVPASTIEYGDLSDWRTSPAGNELIVDPELGRLVSSRPVAFVSYHHTLAIGTAAIVDHAARAAFLPSDVLPIEHNEDVLTLSNTTIAPSPAPSLVVDIRTRRVVVRGCILGPILVSSGRSQPLEIIVSDSVWDASADARDVLLAATADSGAPIEVTLERCTVLGSVAVPGKLELRDSVITGAITAVSWRQWHSQVAGTSPAPLFVARSFALPGYARLSRRCPSSVLNGAHDGGELGAGHGRMFHERLARLSERIDDFVPVGWSVDVRVCDSVSSTREHA